MPETGTTNDPLATAFAGFAASAAGEISAPGAASARRTVGRRRLANSIAGGVAAVAVIGGGVAYATSDHGPATHRLIESAPPAPVGTFTTPTRTDPTPTNTVTGAGHESLVFPAHGGFVTATGVDEKTPTLPAGTYIIYFACMGSGHATASFTAGGPGASTRLACSATDNGAATTVVVHLAHRGRITFRIDPGTRPAAFRAWLTRRS